MNKTHASISLWMIFVLSIGWYWIYDLTISEPHSWDAPTVLQSSSGSATISSESINANFPTEAESLSVSDRFHELAESNEDFAQAIRLSWDTNYTGAIALLEQVKKQLKLEKDKAIIDFNISSNVFELDRLSGVQSFVALSKNPNYPERTRALAMQRIYLLHRKYADDDILRAIAREMQIPWTTVDNVTSQYMQLSYDLYPLPGSALYLLRDALVRAESQQEANIIYEKYKINIDSGIKFMKSTTGELVEATSAMLARARILELLYTRFWLVTREEVESAYRELAQFDQEINFQVNKQYALLSYANFLFSIGEVSHAQRILLIIMNDGLNPALIESLPQSSNFPYIKSFTGYIDPKSKELVDFIGSNL